jgi:protein arginine kinase activator
MQCQACHKNEATIHLTEISDGVRNEMHLCEKCAQQEGIAVKSQIPLNELLSSLLAAQPDEDELLADRDRHYRCPHCGFTLDKFRKHGLLGCPYDYDAFEKTLVPLLEKAHDGNTHHAGKIPTKAPVNAKRQLELMALRRDLEVAVKNEDYERAAELRDKINEAEN